MSGQPSAYVLYCDESVRNGEFYSSFYGGALVSSIDDQGVRARLERAKRANNLFGEIKWQKVTDQYLAKYVRVVDAFFDEVANGRVKVRLMFRQNAARAVGLGSPHASESYFKLYYQFIKHAFGFAYMPTPASPTRLKVLLDQFPDTGEQAARFRGYLLGLNHSPQFASRRLFIHAEELIEVRSHEHVLLQCLDVVLGAIAFRLNDAHLRKPEGETRRGRRTRAKESLYKHILASIRQLRPNFNPGINSSGSPSERWSHAYAHWLFVPSDHDFDPALTKRGKR